MRLFSPQRSANPWTAAGECGRLIRVAASHVGPDLSGGTGSATPRHQTTVVNLAPVPTSMSRHAPAEVLVPVIALIIIAHFCYNTIP